MKRHHYTVSLEWTGNKGSGTFDYRSYARDHEIKGSDKSMSILGSSDPSFRGDPLRYNPEELFLSSISSCHMLWFLHLCSVQGIIVLEYTDEPKGTMIEKEDGSGAFDEVTLYPNVVVAQEKMIPLANNIHEEANKMCFIANSCNFKIAHSPTTITK